MKCYVCNRPCELREMEQVFTTKKGESLLAYQSFYCSHCDESYCNLDQMDDLLKSINIHEISLSEDAIYNEYEMQVMRYHFQETLSPLINQEIRKQKEKNADI